jgi:hypothetical protein
MAMTYNYNDYLQHTYSKREPRDIEYFESKFEARIEDSREYRHYERQMPYYAWDGKEPYNIDTQIVPMKAIHLSSDNLAKLLAEQNLIDILMKDANEGKRIWRQEREDSRVRSQNPTVEKAYRNYQVLLELART